MSNGLGSESFSGKWGRCEQLVFRTASRRVLWCDVAPGDLFGKSVGCTVDKQSGPIGDASTLDVSSAFSSWKTFCGTRPTQTSLWVSRVAAAAKSELLSRGGRADEGAPSSDVECCVFTCLLRLSFR